MWPFHMHKTFVWGYVSCCVQSPSLSMRHADAIRPKKSEKKNITQTMRLFFSYLGSNLQEIDVGHKSLASIARFGLCCCCSGLLVQGCLPLLTKVSQLLLCCPQSCRGVIQLNKCTRMKEIVIKINI